MPKKKAKPRQMNALEEKMQLKVNSVSYTDESEKNPKKGLNVRFFHSYQYRILSIKQKG